MRVQKRIDTNNWPRSTKSKGWSKWHTFKQFLWHGCCVDVDVITLVIVFKVKLFQHWHIARQILADGQAAASRQNTEDPKQIFLFNSYSLVLSTMWVIVVIRNEQVIKPHLNPPKPLPTPKPNSQPIHFDFDSHTNYIFKMWRPQHQVPSCVKSSVQSKKIIRPPLILLNGL